ncbi:MAG: hypothetical protein K2Q12_11180 [Rickettsiales bacterium]|nr:hypothetical protein [Rickettsiales bacterium]
MKKLKYIATQLKELLLLALIALTAVAAIYVTFIVLDLPSGFFSQRPLVSSTMYYSNGSYKIYDEDYKRRASKFR